jgi:hypothetical protein
MISFTSKDTAAQQLILGGASSLTSEKGIVGPFPRYSISREDLTLADGTYLNSKFNITVTGTATLKSGTSQDMLVQGQRQAAVQGEAIILAQLNRNQWPMRGNGVLEIAPYGGLGNKIKYLDARITSIELPEQNETAGVQNQEYTIQFEAYQDGSVGTNANDPGGTTQPTYNLSSVEESWDLNPAEDRYSYGGNNAEGTRYKTYTLTHTISATGLKKFNGGSVDEAWKQAKDFVNSVEVNDPTTTITRNTLGLTGSSNLDVLNDFGHTLTGYEAYDRVRTVSSDVSAGSYTVTDMWVLAQGSDKAVIDMELSLDNSNMEAANMVTISGIVTGLDTGGISTTEGKYANAKAAYNTLSDTFFTVANAFHIEELGTGFAANQPLKNTEYSKTLGINKVMGTISFSVSFNDRKTEHDDVIEDTIQVDDNGGTDVVAIIGVLLKTDGPVIQNMKTVTEKRKSVTYTAKMKTDKREDRPTHGLSVLTDYQPDKSYLSTNTESWNKITGDYVLTLEWVYATAGYLFDRNGD